MPVTTTNLIMGPGELYTGAFGATEPATVVTAPTTGWTNVGGTMDGVTLSVAQEFTELEVDQVVDVPGRRLTKREMTIETNLAEPTLENLAVILNGAAPTTGASEKTWEPVNSAAAFSPSYFAVIVDGLAPNGKRRRFIARRCLSTENVETAYKKDEQTVLSVTWTAHYVSSSVAPFKIVDDTSA